MVDCNLYNLTKLSTEDRLRILDYVVKEKGVKPGDLGVSSTYIRLIRRGVKKITDDLLCRLMAHLSPEEFARLVTNTPVEEASIADIVRVIARAVSDPGFRDVLLDYIDRYLGDYLGGRRRQWVVGEGDIEEFVRAMRLEGRSEKTIRDEVRYIRQALAELDWTLTPEGIREYLAGLAEDGEEYALKHTTYSLKSFLKQVLRSRDPGLYATLYNSFKTYKPKVINTTRLPTIEELRQVLAKIESIEAKVYFLILAEDGLRPGEPFLVTMDDVDLEHGMLRIGKITETKRAFVAFLRSETLDYVKRVYMPRRGEFIEDILKPITASNWFEEDVIERFRNRFLPFDQGRLRREIKDAARQVLGREFELYELRKFFATWMISHGVPESIVNTLQGRAPPSEYRVLIEHYWSPRHEELRKWYLEHAPCLLC